MTSLTGNKLILPYRRERAGEGFLLFEVMVAVAVLAFCLIYILDSFTTALRGLSSSQSYNKAISLLEGKLCEVENVAIKEGHIPEEEDSGDFEEDENFSWKLKPRKIEGLPLYELRLEAYWAERKKEVSTFVVTYLRSK